MKPQQVCKLCGAKLNSYNTTGQCYKHSVTKKQEDCTVDEDKMKVCTSPRQPLLQEERYK